jgi:hypothetical protein
MVKVILEKAKDMKVLSGSGCFRKEGVSGGGFNGAEYNLGDTSWFSNYALGYIWLHGTLISRVARNKLLGVTTTASKPEEAFESHAGKRRRLVVFKFGLSRKGRSRAGN